MQLFFMFDQVYLGEQREQCIWNSFKFKLKFEVAIICNILHFEWNSLTHQKHVHQVSTFNHVIVHCTYVAPFDCCLSIEVEPEPEAAPFVEDPETEPRQQGKQPPIDHVDKNPFPSLSLMHD